MASFVVHMCVAKKINEKLKLNDKKFLLGSIIPDISKITQEDKHYTHFIDEKEISFNNNINLDKFIAKYKNHIKDDFVLGYYVHLYTDYLWYNFYVKDFINAKEIHLLDGKVIDNSSENYVKYVYSDYDNLNEMLIKKYKLNLELFDQELDKIDSIIEEINYNSIQKFINWTKENIAKPPNKDLKIFNLESIIKFIDDTSSEIFLKVISLLEEV